MQPLIGESDTLASVLPALGPHPRIAIDTEADSLHCYFEKLCLIQISVPGCDLLIDPLAGFPLEPLFAALEGKELVIHGADYDLRLLRRVGYAGPAGVFDTMIAARLCGITQFSLAALLKRYFSLEVTKASQKANWARRPLSPQMIDYAIMDTHHLLEIAGFLEAELRQIGRSEWFAQSCERAIVASSIVKERDPEQAWRITGSKDFRGRGAALLRALWQWRDSEAQTADRPSFHILHNEMLIEAAHRLERGQEVEIDHLKGGRRRRFFKAAERAMAKPESEWPQFVRNPRPRPTRDEEVRCSEFRVKRDALATSLQLDPSLIAPKSTLEGLAANREETAARMMAWQRELMGLA